MDALQRALQADGRAPLAQTALIEAQLAALSAKHEGVLAQARRPGQLPCPVTERSARLHACAGDVSGHYVDMLTGCARVRRAAGRSGRAVQLPALLNVLGPCTCPRPARLDGAAQACSWHVSDVCS